MPLAIKFREEEHGHDAFLWHRISLEDHSFRALRLAIARALRRPRFALQLEADGSELSAATFPAAAAAASAAAMRIVVRHVDADGSLSSTSNFAQWVDPFWGCEKTALPQLQGVAAAWFWPKAQQGNTHPGATLPNGTVSVCPHSGAYPTGYGLNAQAGSGAPTLLLDGQSGCAGWSAPATQYSCTGFAHMQQSGTGSIGNYYNFVRVAPLRLSAADFSAGAVGTGLVAP